MDRAMLYGCPVILLAYRDDLDWWLVEVADLDKTMWAITSHLERIQ